MKTGTDGVLLGAWTELPSEASVIDAGCGSGLISLMLAQRYTHVNIIAVEIDNAAATAARRNVDSSPWSNRVTVKEGDILHMTVDTLADDLSASFPEKKNSASSATPPIWIVSNPPFFTEALRSPTHARALARHGEGLNVESLIVLAADLDEASRSRFCAGVGLSFIAPYCMIDNIRYNLSLCRYSASRICRVISREGLPPSRVMVEAIPDRYANVPCKFSDLTIRTLASTPTEPYRNLTSQFYLDF